MEAGDRDLPGQRVMLLEGERGHVTDENQPTETLIGGLKRGAHGTAVDRWCQCWQNTATS
jgi:hypothetical protein